MSWDVFLANIPHSVAHVDELDDLYSEADPPPTISRAALVAAIHEVFPGVTEVAADFLRFDGDGFSIEFSLSEEEELDSAMLSARGGSDAVFAIALLLERTGLRGIDPGSENGFFSVEGAGESFEAWEKYRDRVLANG
jgi:hypothetical protein